MAFSSSKNVMALPLELIDEVCSYLEAEDLLNLSATNTFWRNAVNRNSVWKPLCVKYFNVSPSEKPIIDRKCRVKPAFETVANSSDNLSDICSWRIRYAQEIHVVNNWIHQRYHIMDQLSVPIPRFTQHGFILGNFLVFTYYKGLRTCKYAIWDLKNDTIAHHNRVDEFYSFRNGFLACYKNIISYYVLKEDVFELKIRTVYDKALHPEVPLLADISSLQNYKPTIFHCATQNERYVVPYRNEESGTVVVWDFKYLNTFSFDLSVFDSSAADANKNYDLTLGENESSILFLQVGTPVNTLFILSIQNSTIVLLYKHQFKDFFSEIIVDDSIALLFKNEIKFIGNKGSIRNVDCSRVETLINCRSHYCGIRYTSGCEYHEVFLMDKKSFTIQVIKRYEATSCITLSPFLDCSSLHLVFVEDASGTKELIDLKKLNFIELDGGFHTSKFKSNKLILNEHGEIHFW